MHPSVEYLLIGAVAFAVTLLTTPLVPPFARRIGAVAVPRDRDVHAAIICRAGGLAMAAGTSAGLLAAHALPALRTAFIADNSVGSIAAGGALLVVLGLVDDAIQLGSLTKLCGQVVAFSIPLVFGAFAPLMLPIPFLGAVSVDESTSIGVGIAVSVVIVNAVNFIDGLDGLAASQVALISASIVLFAHQLAARHLLEVTATPELIASVLCGASLAFLVFNAPPAHLFMGDTGSMVCGYLLSMCLLGLLTRAAPESITSTHVSLAVYLPLLIGAAFLAIPLFDLAAAVVRRLKGRRSIFSADKHHLHHWVLARCNGSTLRAVLVLDLTTVAVIALALVNTKL